MGQYFPPGIHHLCETILVKTMQPMPTSVEIYQTLALVTITVVCRNRNGFRLGNVANTTTRPKRHHPLLRTAMTNDR